ncbi:15358_t:CDS:2 [Funneliformis caledonium]|uniref:15358_t:CDS:1 n=1 Tax=Funneliformis caledonium TaxID=1117310 RepID=A0A9N9GYS5_9GLOM|nr:15358_t:CDS:2 [Funneliformis caledonium]
MIVWFIPARASVSTTPNPYDMATNWDETYYDGDIYYRFIVLGFSLFDSTNVENVLSTITKDVEKVDYLRGYVKSKEPFKEKQKEKELDEFWEDLKNAKINDNEKFLRLSEGITFLGKEGGSSILYIRKSYRYMEKVIFKDSTRKLRITGNPGIGKTFFGFYLLYLLSQQTNTRIVYSSFTERSPIIFDGEAFTTDNQTLINTYLYNKDTWYIADGIEPKNVNAKTILVCSPRKEHYKRFDRYTGRIRRYMPVWTLEEIEVCRSNVFKNIDKITVEKMYNMWGGIPRYVLELTDDDSQAELEHAINNVNNNILYFVGESEGDICSSHKLAHIYTNDDPEENEEPYTKIIMRFASEYVAERIVSKIEERYKHELKCFVKSSSSESAFYSLRGALFEEIAHRILQKGGKFKIRPLDFTSKDSYIEIPKLEMCFYSKIDEIEVNKYYRPIQKNWESIDAIISPNVLFQMTVGSTHPVKMNGLDKLCEKLGGKLGNNKISFYFVLPKDQYVNFKKQNFHTADKKVARNIKRWINDRVRQYALEIDLSSW